MEPNYHIVNFEEYCHKCKYADYSEEEEPCCDCLEEPIAEDSRRPVRYKEAKEKKKKK